jgi:DNA-binding PadR family transcriptional regulator
MTVAATACPPFHPYMSQRWRRRLAGASVLAMTARGHGRGRGRRGGPPFGRGAFPFGPSFMGGPGGFRRGPRARRGDVRAAALLLLAEEPRNGYQLMQEIEARSNGVWRPSPGSVYPALSQLEDEGLVRVEESDGRRTFTLTDEGRAHVEEHRAELGSPWDEMSGAIDDDVAGLATEVRQVMMAVGQIGHVGSAGQIETASKILADARRALYGILAEDEPAEKESGE